MPIPTPNYSTNSGKNPYSTVTLPEQLLKEHGGRNYRLTGLAASTTYTVGTPSAAQLPGLYLVTVDGTVEYGLFVDIGGDNNLVKVAGTTNVETVDNGGAAAGTRISLSKINTTGALTVVTGAATLIGTAISIFKIV